MSVQRTNEGMTEGYMDVEQHHYYPPADPEEVEYYQNFMDLVQARPDETPEAEKKPMVDHIDRIVHECCQSMAKLINMAETTTPCKETFDFMERLNTMWLEVLYTIDKKYVVRINSEEGHIQRKSQSFFTRYTLNKEFPLCDSVPEELDILVGQGCRLFVLTKRLHRLFPRLFSDAFQLLLDMYAFCETPFIPSKNERLPDPEKLKKKIAEHVWSYGRDNSRFKTEQWRQIVDSHVKTNLPAETAKSSFSVRKVINFVKNSVTSAFKTKDQTKIQEKIKKYVDRLHWPDIVQFALTFFPDWPLGAEVNHEKLVDLLLENYGYLFWESPVSRSWKRLKNMSAIFAKRLFAVGAGYTVLSRLVQRIIAMATSSSMAAFTAATQTMFTRSGIPIDIESMTQYLAEHAETFAPVLEKARQTEGGVPPLGPERDRFIQTHFPDNPEKRSEFGTYLSNVDKADFVTQWTEVVAERDAVRQNDPEHETRLAKAETKLAKMAKKEYGVKDVDKLLASAYKVPSPGIQVTSDGSWRNTLMWSVLGSVVMGLLVSTPYLREEWKRQQEQDEYVQNILDMSDSPYIAYPPLNRRKKRLIWP